ncbi:hypothetical protein DFR68_10944 [Nocardia mexicana]|uniref:Uncharacterized protein n=1 Tax=Nocardia mexicana TaxID=279262 RepID=A0A370GTM9_9NOCA|nr:hypothetical protein DFR68_10944 [Nocardia mexicana]
MRRRPRRYRISTEFRGSRRPIERTRRIRPGSNRMRGPAARHPPPARPRRTRRRRRRRSGAPTPLPGYTIQAAKGRRIQLRRNPISDFARVDRRNPVRRYRVRPGRTGRSPARGRTPCCRRNLFRSIPLRHGPLRGNRTAVRIPLRSNHCHRRDRPGPGRRSSNNPGTSALPRKHLPHNRIRRGVRVDPNIRRRPPTRSRRSIPCGPPPPGATVCRGCSPVSARRSSWPSP